MAEHDLKLHLGCIGCRRAVSFSYHVEQPPSEKDRHCTACGEPMQTLYFDEQGRLSHADWEDA